MKELSLLKRTAIVELNRAGFQGVTDCKTADMTSTTNCEWMYKTFERPWKCRKLDLKWGAIFVVRERSSET